LHSNNLWHDSVELVEPHWKWG